jgi:alpha-tubulin suppressor-like RCC1 family protein
MTRSRDLQLPLATAGRDCLYALFIMALLLSPGCGDGGGLTPPPSSPTPEELQIVSGNGQNTLPGAAAAPLRVRVIGSDGHPFAGTTVQWSITQGQATLDPAQSTSNVSGEAETQVQMGPTAGTVTVRASVEDLSPVTFSITAVNPPSAFSPVTAGNRHTCKLSFSGAASCWGDNEFGQLGDGTTTDRQTAVLVSGGPSFAALSAGGLHICGLTADGAAYCWGSNEFGQLGDGTTTNRSSPVLVSGGLSFAAVSAGGSHTCGVTTQGAAYCWGWNSKGQLGDGTQTNRSSPAPVLGGLSFLTLTTGDAATEAGGEFSCGITTTGTYCWGRNFSGQLGDGSGETQLTPVPVAGNVSLAAVSAGGSHACALTAGGAAYCWGTYALGNGNGATRFTPTAAAGGATFLVVSAGGHHTCGITTAGTTTCWGHNESAQLGDGTRAEDRENPVTVLGGLSFVAVSSGGWHTCGVTATDEIYCWGDNTYGQLGDGTRTSRTTPTPVVQ